MSWPEFSPTNSYYATARFVGEQCTDDIICQSKGSKRIASLNDLDEFDTNNRFRNTRLCIFHQKGACSKGSECSYAHSEDELKLPPNLLKTRLCQDWLNGRCTTIDCKFAHGRNELRFTHDYYKTKLCHYWQQGGCSKGELCRHAHGEAELRPMPIEEGSRYHLNIPDERIFLASGATRAETSEENLYSGVMSEDEFMMIPKPDRNLKRPHKNIDDNPTDVSRTVQVSQQLAIRSSDILPTIGCIIHSSTTDLEQLTEKLSLLLNFKDIVDDSDQTLTSLSKLYSLNPQC